MNIHSCGQNNTWKINISHATATGDKAGLKALGGVCHETLPEWIWRQQILLSAAPSDLCFVFAASAFAVVAVLVEGFGTACAFLRAKLLHVP